jgi:hypothetical protein
MVLPSDDRSEKADRQRFERTALFGCTGTVLAAIISGMFLLISTGALHFDLQLTCLPAPISY